MIKIYNQDDSLLDLDYESFVFNGGEEHVKLNFNSDHLIDNVRIVATLDNSSEVIKLLLITDALRRLKADLIIDLFMPYLPYARQDRVCNKGESLSIKVFCDLINSQGYDSVTTLDNHSDVSTALLDRCLNLGFNDWFNPDVNGIIKTSSIERKMSTKNIKIISPDAGSLKKCYEISKYWGGIGIVKADKKRDVSTGEIISTEVYVDDLKGSDVVIVDDICDGGRTFIEIAKVLKTKNVGMIYLVVSHGIFSKGLEVFDGLIDEIITTNSFSNEYSDKVMRVNLFSRKRL